MSEENTKEFEQSKSFEERVFLRFDAMDERITSLEVKEDRRQYETKPLWEKIVLTLDKLGEKVDAGFADMNARFSSINERLDKMDQRFEHMDERITVLATGVDQELPKVNRKLDVLNQWLLESRADHHDVESRLEKLESTSTKT